MIDKYGRIITDEGNGIFSVEGLIVDTEGGSIEDALHIFNAMPTGDYKNPEIMPETNANIDEISKAISTLSKEALDALKLALGI